MWPLLIVLSLIGLGIIGLLYLILKKLSSLSPQIIVKNEQNFDIEKQVAGGMKSAIKSLEHEKEEYELLMKRLDAQEKGAKGVFTTTNQEEPINTQGYLIAANLSDVEKEILREFYGQ